MKIKHKLKKEEKIKKKGIEDRVQYGSSLIPAGKDKMEEPKYKFNEHDVQDRMSYISQLSFTSVELNQIA